MTRGQFLKNLKSSSNRIAQVVLLPVVLLPVGIFLVSACANTPARKLDSTKPDSAAKVEANNSTARRSKSREVPIPPWQLWRSESLNSPELQAAEGYSRQGDFTAAIHSYQDALSRADQQFIRQAAALRLCGTLLKVGKSQQALEEMSKYLNSQGAGPQDADAQLALVAAYAYLSKNDFDQALAWFGAAYRKAGSQAVVASRAQSEARNLIRSLPADSFDNYSERWGVDDFSGKMFFAERMRRSQGGSPANIEVSQWFSPNYYAQPDNDRMTDPRVTQGSDLGMAADHASSANALVGNSLSTNTIGVLLPLTGRFAEHAAQVRRGIELAIAKTPGQTVRLVFEDTQGNPAVAERAYDRLVQEEKVSLVLGPLLVKTTEYVAERSRSLGVPIITFTKREGVPALGSTVFRLGATSIGQVQELLTYASGELKFSTASILYPDNESGREFAAIFRRESQRYKIQIVEQAPYRSGDQQSINSAVAKVSASSAQALFLPDSLEQSFAVLERISVSPQLKDVVLLGPAQWNDPIAIRGYGQLIDGAVFVTPFFLSSERPRVTQFVADFRHAYQREPDLLAAQAYDAAQLAVNAIHSVDGNVDLAQRLEIAPVLDGITGMLDVTQDGEIQRRMSVLRISRGQIVEIMWGGVISGFIGNEQAERKQQNKIF